MSRIYPLAKRDTMPLRSCRRWQLSEGSPDWYNGDEDQIPPPFEVELILGSRIGWRWKSTCYYSDYDGDSVEETTISCEINWLEPEPDRGSGGYEDYIRTLDALKKEIGCYNGYNQPPTEEEYLPSSVWRVCRLLILKWWRESNHTQHALTSVRDEQMQDWWSKVHHTHVIPRLTKFTLLLKTSSFLWYAALPWSLLFSLTYSIFTQIFYRYLHHAPSLSLSLYYYLCKYVSIAAAKNTSSLFIT